MSLSRVRTRPVPSGFIPLCHPVSAKIPPSGSDWLHEIKHDGYRLQLRRVGARVTLYTKSGHDWTDRFPRIVAGAREVGFGSFVIDGEAVAVDRDGVPVFKRLRSQAGRDDALLFAFDILALDDEDVRPLAYERRKDLLAQLLSRSVDGIAISDHAELDGPVVLAHAAKLGLEGIVSKRRNAPYVAGQLDGWVKVKNPDSPAALREAEEDWNSRRRSRR
jgi:ATP-dependent DNA ligase